MFVLLLEFSKNVELYHKACLRCVNCSEGFSQGIDYSNRIFILSKTATAQQTAVMAANGTYMNGINESEVGIRFVTTSTS